MHKPKRKSPSEHKEIEAAQRALANAKLAAAGYVLIGSTDDIIDSDLLEKISFEGDNLAKLLITLGFTGKQFEAVAKPPCFQLIAFQHGKRIYFN